MTHTMIYSPNQSLYTPPTNVTPLLPISLWYLSLSLLSSKLSHGPRLVSWNEAGTCYIDYCKLSTNQVTPLKWYISYRQSNILITRPYIRNIFNLVSYNRLPLGSIIRNWEQQQTMISEMDRKILWRRFRTWSKSYHIMRLPSLNVIGTGSGSLQWVSVKRNRVSSYTNR